MGSLALQEDRLRSEDKRAGAQIGARLATQLAADQAKDRREGAKIGLQAAQTIINEAKGDRGGTAGDTQKTD
jgi:hypothetical protein